MASIWIDYYCWGMDAFSKQKQDFKETQVNKQKKKPQSH